MVVNKLNASIKIALALVFSAGLTAQANLAGSTAQNADASLEEKARNITGPTTGAIVEQPAGQPQPGEIKLDQADVRKLQGALKEIGFYTGPVDGVWSRLTEQALSRLQQAAKNQLGSGQKEAKKRAPAAEDAGSR